MIKSFIIKNIYFIATIIFHAFDAHSLRSNCLDYTVSSKLKLLKTECDPSNPKLFKDTQCSFDKCFCMNKVTGKVFQNTEFIHGTERDCHNKFIRLDLSVPNKQLIGGKLKGPSTIDENSLSAQEYNSRVVENAAREMLDKIVVAKYYFDSVTRNDSPSIDGMYSFYRVSFYLLGDQGQIEETLAKIKSQLEKHQIGSVEINNKITKLATVENFQLEIQNELDTDTKRRGENKSEPAQSDYPSDSKKEDEIKYANSSPNEIQNKNYLPKTEGKSFLKEQFEFLINQPGALTGVIGAVLTILLLFILLIAFCVYRLRKRDQGSYTLDEAKKVQVNPAYTRAPTREFYA